MGASGARAAGRVAGETVCRGGLWRDAPGFSAIQMHGKEDLLAASRAWQSSYSRGDCVLLQFILSSAHCRSGTGICRGAEELSSALVNKRTRVGMGRSFADGGSIS